MTDERRTTIDRRRLLQGGAAAATVSSLPAAAATSTPYPRFRKGIGVHNVLNWPDTHMVGGELQYDWPPFNQAHFRITDAELAALKATGLDFLRITVDPSILISSPEDRLPLLYGHDKEVVRHIMSSGMKVVFDLHPTAVNPRYNPSQLIAPASPAFDQYLTMVGRVAAQLKDLPFDRFAFEVFNEPWLGDLGQAKRWQSMAEALHANVRAVSPNMPIVLGGAQWNSIAGLRALNLEPFRTSNVLYTFHYYDPHPFTHQGMRGQDTAPISGLNWPIAGDQLNSVEERALTRLNADSRLTSSDRENDVKAINHYFSSLRSALPGVQQIHDDFAHVEAWARSNRLAPDQIILGEFGCVDAALGEPTGVSRLNWLKTVRTTCETVGFGWSYWGYKGDLMRLARDNGTLDGPTLTALGLAT